MATWNESNVVPIRKDMKKGFFSTNTRRRVWLCVISGTVIFWVMVGIIIHLIVE